MLFDLAAAFVLAREGAAPGMAEDLEARRLQREMAEEAHGATLVPLTERVRSAKLSITHISEAGATEGPYVNLVSGDRSIHILYGDATGGGHLWPGLPGKTPFPESWSAPKILHGVSDIVTDPAVPWVNQTGKQGAFFTASRQPRPMEGRGGLGRREK